MNSCNQPRVSVGMPVRNCERTLEMAIRSMQLQTYENWELLLMDDGSTDRSAEIARSFDDGRIRVAVGGVRRGLSSRLNDAIAMSTGHYFARMDGDDVAYPERFERQVQYLEEHSEVDLLGAGILVFKCDGHAMGTRTIWQMHEEICRRPWAGFYLPHPTWMGRTAWFRKHPYRLQAIRMEDQDLMLRSYQTSRFASLPEILVGYREDHFSLRKSLSTRFHFVKLFAGIYFRNGSERSFVWRGVAEHVLKGIVEVFAVLIGLTYPILRHRARPIDSNERRRWALVWAALSKAATDDVAQGIRVVGQASR
jgi:glycosyltransferase involved in cell wall biosynthesis